MIDSSRFFNTQRMHPDDSEKALELGQTDDLEAVGPGLDHLKQLGELREQGIDVRALYKNIDLSRPDRIRGHNR